MIDKAKLSAIALQIEASSNQGEDDGTYSVLCEFGEMAKDNCEETRVALRELFDGGIITKETEESLIGYLDGLPDSYDESNLGANVMKVKVLMKEGRLEEAVVFGEKVLELTPEDVDFRQNVMVYLYDALGNFEAVIRHLKHLVALEPDNIMYLSSLGSAYKMAKKTEESEAIVRKLEKLKPTKIMMKLKQTDLQHRMMLGISYALNERVEEANEIAEGITSLTSNDPNDFNYGALLFMCLGDAKKALQYLEKAIKIDPNNTLALVIRNKILNHVILDPADIQRILN